MARKNPLVNPLNKLKDTALGAISDPKGTADKVVEQAKGAASLGKMVAEGVAGEVVSRTRGRKASDAPSAETPPAQPATAPPAKRQGDPLAPTRRAPAKKSTAKKSAAKKAAPAEPPVDKDDKQAAKKASPADVAKKAAKKAPAKKAAAKKTATKESAKKSADTASAKKAPAKKAAAKKAPAKKAAGSPGDKLPPRKRTTSAAELAEGGPGVETPVGTTGAAPGTNPDTAESDLQQPGTEGIVESSTAKKIAKQAERGRRDAEQ